VIDPNAMELISKVGELERNRIKEGQSVDIQLNALPGTMFHGTVKTVAGNNARRFWDDDTSTNLKSRLPFLPPILGCAPVLRLTSPSIAIRVRTSFMCHVRRCSSRTTNGWCTCGAAGNFDTHEVKDPGGKRESSRH